MNQVPSTSPSSTAINAGSTACPEIRARLYPLFVAESPIQGRGCFSAAQIPADTVFCEYQGELISYDEGLIRSDPKNAKHSQYILKTDDGRFIDGAIRGNDSRFINHSCTPNCEILYDGSRAFLISLRAIQFGEELTMDYEYDEPYREPCSCGATECRGYM